MSDMPAATEGPDVAKQMRLEEPSLEIESFDALFERLGDYKDELANAITSMFALTSKLQPRADDLPANFLTNDPEILWQFVSHSGKQIIKEFRKRAAFLEQGVVLQDHVTSSNEDELEDEDVTPEHSDDDDIDEEEDVDLLNLKDEDLKDLEKEMDEMRDEEEEEGMRLDEDDETPSNNQRKKYPKSQVDDKFFSLAEMNAFLDEQDRVGTAETDILDSVDDSTGVAADYCYEDFFGKEEGEKRDQGGKKLGTGKKSSDERTDLPKKKSVRFAVDNEENNDEDEEDENDSDEIEDEDTEGDGPVILGEDSKSDEPTSNLKKTLNKLKQTITKLEEENLAPRSWQLSGEVTAQQREENELLETHVQFDHGIKKAPEITELFTEKLEDLIKQRIKDKVFDDVVRKKRVEERVETYRNQAIEEQELVKTSLADVYEKEYQSAAGEAKSEQSVNEEHVALEKRMRELFRLIDALSNFDYTPPEVRPEVRVVSNMAALRVEEKGMSASTDAQLLAPEELKKRQKGDLKADEERDRTDKLRQRRKKKNRQRAMVELFGEEKALESQKKKKKRLSAEDKGATGAGGGELKSSAFFSKLQETVRNEIKQKTTKKTKVKSQQVNDGGSKYML
ncbi:hypothetical protein Q1695_014483 [Nippostrongylus brasiliensis]|nr:hypothetical protein Q1695_014483 [Nippostrongylus brasiliensis]